MGAILQELSCYLEEGVDTLDRPLEWNYKF